MALRLRNSWSYRGADRWDWKIYVDDSGSGELKDVDYVEYVLHPTFAQPVRRITDPTDGFALKTNGWGTFEVTAFVHKKDKAVARLSHSLRLLFEPPQGETP